MPLTRRESLCSMLAGIVGAKAAPGAKVEAIEEKEGNPIVAWKVKVPHDIAPQQEERIAAIVREVLGDDKAPVFVCRVGVDITPVYAHGSQAKYTHHEEIDGAAITVGFQTKEELDAWKAEWKASGTA